MAMATIGRALRTRLRSRRFLIHWVGMFAGIVGVTAAIVTLVPQFRLSFIASASLIILAIAISSVYAWCVARPLQLRADDVLPEGYSAGRCLIAGCVQDREPARQVNELAAEVYPGVTPLPLDRYEQWMVVNPYLLTCLFGPDGRVVGYFDVFPLRSDFMNLLVEGLCGEQDIRREHILSPQEAASVTRIYLAGVAVADRDTQHGRNHASMLVWVLMKYLQRYYPAPPVRELFAAAVTDEGEKLLRRFHFTFVAGSRGRKDPYPLYSATLTPETLQAMLDSMPDWSTRVRLDWPPE